MVFVVGIAGPSGSGKSTLAKNAAQELKNATLLHADSFFIDREKAPIVGNWRNQETPTQIKWNELHEAIRSLQQGKETTIPLYERKLDKQTGTQKISPAEIVLVDGFLLFHDDETRKLLDSLVFVETRLETQLARRKQRQSNFEEDYFHQVMKPAFEQYIAPTKQFAHLVLDGEKSIEENTIALVQFIQKSAKTQL